MAALSGSSTDAEVWQSYDDNASYEEDASVSKARAFVTACQILLRRQPSNISLNGRTVAFDPKMISDSLDRARTWIATNNTTSNGGSVRHLSFRNLRD